MKKTSSLLLSTVNALICFMVIPVQGRAPLPEPVFFQGHYYTATNECQTWIEANVYADGQYYTDPVSGKPLQGHLVTITSTEEQDFVYRTFVNQEWTHAWLGAYRVSDQGDPDDNWVWVTGEPWEYTHWAPGQPEANDENRASMMNYTDGTWHDYGEYYYECGYRFTVVEFELPILLCHGFEPPAHNAFLSVHGLRSVPLKMRLFDRQGNDITPDLLAAPPLLTATVYAGRNGEDQAQPVIVGPFEYRNNRWVFTLAPESWPVEKKALTFSVQTGSPDDYSIATPCSVTVSRKYPVEILAGGFGVFYKVGSGPPTLHFIQNSFAVAGYKVHGADSAIGHGQEAFTERAGMESIVDA